MCALQLRKQGAGESAIIGSHRENQLETEETKINKKLAGEAETYQSIGPSLGSIGRSRTGGHE
jgi:hypothetical protein